MKSTAANALRWAANLFIRLGKFPFFERIMPTCSASEENGIFRPLILIGLKVLRLIDLAFGIIWISLVLLELNVTPYFSQ